MKYTLTLILCSLIITSCDQPIKNRELQGQIGYPGSSSNSNGFNFGGSISDNNNSGSGLESNQDTPSNGNDVGFESCNFEKREYISRFGYFSVCQSSSNEKFFKVKFSSSVSNPICFVPTHINEDDTSFKVGPAECSQSLQVNKVYNVPVTKDVSSSINGLMVIAYESLNPYMQCMTFKASYLQAYPQCVTNSQCMASINSQAQSLCQSFKQTHSSKYNLVKFN